MPLLTEIAVGQLEMAVQFQYLESFLESLQFRHKELLAVVYLVLLAALHLPRAMSLALRRYRLKAARAKELDLIVAFNQMESYLAENYCAVCYSSATRRCPKCGAVAYCSEKCQRDHWEQLHNKECPLMAELKGCNMAHLVTYSNLTKQCKPCKVAGKSANFKDDPESERRKLNPGTKCASKQEGLATAKNPKMMEIPQFVARKSEEECVVVNSNSLSNSRPSIKPQLVRDGRKTKRISSPRPSYSSYRDSSDSDDAMSSLHGLDD